MQGPNNIVKIVPLRIVLFFITFSSFLSAGGLLDGFGYSAISSDEPDGTPFAFRDISETGATVERDLFGVAGLVDLEAPFPFYGEFHSQLLMSGNGYLTPDTEDQASDTPGSTLPEESVIGSGARIYPFHENISAFEGTLSYQYFPEGLRDYPLLPQVGVSIFQWTDVVQSGSDPFTFQALLFDDGTIHFVYPGSNPFDGSEAIVGIQNAAATNGEQGAIGLPIITEGQSSLPANSTITIYPPTSVLTSSADFGPGSLRDLIEEAPNPSVITVSPELKNATIDLTRFLQVSNKALTLNGAGITLDGGGRSGVMTASREAYLSLNACHVTRGRALNGGGLLVSMSSRALILNSTFYQNDATNAGGALRLVGSARIENTTIFDNGAGRVGSNSPPNFGGGISAREQALTLINCTIVDNVATTFSGGISRDFVGPAQLRGTIVAGNSTLDGRNENPEMEGLFESQGGNFIGDNSDNAFFRLAEFPDGSPNTNGDFVGTADSPLIPMLAEGLTDNGGPTLTLMPLPDSPLIDRNGSENLPDQRGISPFRVRDIGAVETQWDRHVSNDQIPTATFDVTQPTDAVSIFPPGAQGALGSVRDLFDNNTATIGGILESVNAGFTITPASGSTRLQSVRLSLSTSPILGRSNDPANFLLLGSQDLRTFTPIASGVVPEVPETAESDSLDFRYTLTGPIETWRHYRMIFPGNRGGTSLLLGEVELLGLPETALGEAPVITDTRVFSFLGSSTFAMDIATQPGARYEIIEQDNLPATQIERRQLTADSPTETILDRIDFARRFYQVTRFGTSSTDLSAYIPLSIDLDIRNFNRNNNPFVVRRGDTSIVAEPLRNGAASFDGDGDYLEINGLTIPSGSAYTVSAWFQTDRAPESDAESERQTVFETSPNFAISFGLREGTPASDTRLEFLTEGTQFSRRTFIELPDTEVVGKWHQVVMSYDGAGEVECYLDGFRVGTIFGFGIPMPFNSFHLGTYRDADNRWFSGLLDEVIIWERQLDATEIYLLYNNGVPENVQF